MSDIDRRIEELLELLSNRDDPDSRCRLERLLSRDKELSEVYRLIRDIEGEWHNPPWKPNDRAVESLAGRMIRDMASVPDKTRDNRGVLVFDSSFLPQPAGVRPAIPDTRDLTYLFGNYELRLSLYHISPDSFEMIGQIPSGEPVSITEVVLRSGRTVLKARPDTFGVFRFERISRRNYELILNTEGDESLVCAVEL